jgi:hypothetical protein
MHIHCPLMASEWRRRNRALRGAHGYHGFTVFTVEAIPKWFSEAVTKVPSFGMMENCHDACPNPRLGVSMPS